MLKSFDFVLQYLLFFGLEIFQAINAVGLLLQTSEITIAAVLNLIKSLQDGLKCIR